MYALPTLTMPLDCSTCPATPSTCPSPAHTNLITNTAPQLSTSQDLSHTDVGPRGVAWLAQLPALHTLSLSDCRRIDDEALASISSLTALGTLALRNTEVSNSGLRHLRTLRLLRSLSLGSRFELDDEGLGALAGCASLRRLSAGSFNLKRLLPRGAFPALEHLSFGGGFANKGLQLLFPLPALRSLHVQVGGPVWGGRAGSVACIVCAQQWSVIFQHGTASVASPAVCSNCCSAVVQSVPQVPFVPIQHSPQHELPALTHLSKHFRSQPCRASTPSPTAS